MVVRELHWFVCRGISQIYMLLNKFINRGQNMWSCDPSCDKYCTSCGCFEMNISLYYGYCLVQYALIYSTWSRSENRLDVAGTLSWGEWCVSQFHTVLWKLLHLWDLNTYMHPSIIIFLNKYETKSVKHKPVKTKGWRESWFDHCCGNTRLTECHRRDIRSKHTHTHIILRKDRI